MNSRRRRREDLRTLVQTEIQRQVHALGIATRDDLDRLERKLAGKPAAASAAKKTSAAKKAPAKKAPAKKAAAGASGRA